MPPMSTSLPIVPLGRPGDAPARSGCGGGGGGGRGRGGKGCGCGHQGQPETATPEHGQPDAASGEMVLDVRNVPLGIRSSTALAVFGSVPADGSLVIVTSGEPINLLHQLDTEARGALDVEYLDTTPGAWRVRVTRR